MTTQKAMRLAKRRKQKERKHQRIERLTQRYEAELKASGMSREMFNLKRAFDALRNP